MKVSASAHFSHIPHVADCRASPQNKQTEKLPRTDVLMSSSLGRGFAVVLQHGDPENGLRKEQIPIGNGSCSGFILNFEGVVQVDTTLLFCILPAFVSNHIHQQHH